MPATTTVAPTRTAPDFPTFRQSLVDSLDPRTPLESFLADRLAHLAWRLHEATTRATQDPESNDDDRLLTTERRLQPLFSRTLTHLRQLQSDRRKHPPEDRPQTTHTPAAPPTNAPQPQSRPTPPAPQREGEAPSEPGSTRGASPENQTERAPLPPRPPAPFIDQADPTIYFGNTPADILRRAQSYALTPILHRKRKLTRI